MNKKVRLDYSHKTKIELLSCQLLSENEQTIKDIDLLREGLIKDIGWHYLVDLIWIVNSLKNNNILPGATILDAGAGNGLLQYLLSFYGYNVISVDFSPRTNNLLVSNIFPIEKPEKLVSFSHPYISFLNQSNNFLNKVKRLGVLLRTGNLKITPFFRLFYKTHFSGNRLGIIKIYLADIQKMNEIQSNTIDAIVSLSVIEHMEINSIKKAINEFERVLKIDHPMILTTNASKFEYDWYHKPSEGLCFSLKTLSTLFHCESIYSHKFDDFDDVLIEYKNNTYLENRLASFHYLSNNNGMPNGIWDPKYVPVGVVSINKVGK